MHWPAFHERRIEALRMAVRTGWKMHHSHRVLTSYRAGRDSQAVDKKQVCNGLVGFS